MIILGCDRAAFLVSVLYLYKIQIYNESHKIVEIQNNYNERDCIVSCL